MSKDRIWFGIPRSNQARVFFILLGFTLVLMISLQVIGGPLQTNAAPSGIISYELAGSLDNAWAMLNSWGSEGQVFAALSLGLDYLFLVAYSITIALGCRIVASNLHPRFGFLIRLGILLSWAQFLAALLDALENYALIRILLGSENALWPPTALWSAVPKFIIVVLGIVYILAGAIMTLIPKNRSVRASP
ncbi:MAG TPA: hypothetical protein G4O08_03510 [Anaerolineae bacterium]|nr:hypothetical protein [Anaerolineae bacterium]